MGNKLSQDLPVVEDIDILWGFEEAMQDTDSIIPEDTTPAVVPKEEVPVDKPAEVKEEIEEGDEDITLESILGDSEGIDKEVNEMIDKTVEIKETIEEAKVAIKDDDNDTAEKLIDTLYSQVIEYSTKVDTLSAKNDVLQSKLIELTTNNSDYELQIAQNTTKSNDPKMIIMNRMYDNATSWDEDAKAKVVTTLEDMYYNLTSKSFDDTRVWKVSDENAGQVILNELTSPVIEEEKSEVVDLNDITSIF